MKPYIRLAGCVLAALLFMPDSQAATTQSTPFRVEVLDEGQYVPVGSVRVKPSDRAASGRVGSHEGLEQVSSSREVSAKLGTTFGFRYRVLGLPEGEADGFEMRAVHPPMASPSGKISTVSSAPSPLLSEGGQAFGDLVYRLSEPSELLPGQWILQILYRGQVVINREFTVR